MTFPKTFQERFYGDFDSPYIFNNGDELMYNFPISSSLFRINDDRGISEIVELTSEGETKTIEPLSESAYEDFAGKRLNYFFNSARYFPLVYDRFRELYYLVKKGETKNEEDRYNKNVLMILSKNFEYIDEVKLDPKLTPIYGVVKEGIYFLYNQENITSESYMSLVIIDISVVGL